LAALDGHVGDVRQAEGEEQGGTTYTGALDAEAVKALARSEHRSVARGGTARVTVGADGLIARYEIAVTLKGRLGNAEVDGTATRSVTLGMAGSARVEVPEGAKKALE
jgi:hypothetical protein